jgi:hypothetical protein
MHLVVREDPRPISFRMQMIWWRAFVGLDEDNGNEDVRLRGI